MDMGSFRSGGTAEVQRTNEACASNAGQICCGEVVSAGGQEVDETVGGVEASWMVHTSCFQWNIFNCLFDICFLSFWQCCSQFIQRVHPGKDEKSILYLQIVPTRHTLQQHPNTLLFSNISKAPAFWHIKYCILITSHNTSVFPHNHVAKINTSCCKPHTTHCSWTKEKSRNKKKRHYVVFEKKFREVIFTLLIR